jgi:hypothetical protein
MVAYRKDDAVMYFSNSIKSLKIHMTARGTIHGKSSGLACLGLWFQFPAPQDMKSIKYIKDTPKKYQSLEDSNSL